MKTSLRTWHDDDNRMMIVTVRSDDLGELKNARNYILNELEKMKLLIGNRVEVMRISTHGWGMDFQVIVPDSIYDIPGAVEWLYHEVLDKVEG